MSPSSLRLQVRSGLNRLCACAAFVFAAAFGQVSSAAETTLTFTTNDDTNWNDGVAEDGNGGSTDIAGITIRVYNVSDESGTQLAKRLVVGHAESADNFHALTSYDLDLGGLGWRGMGIASADGKDFQLNGFAYWNYGESDPVNITVKGYRNGWEVASTSFTSAFTVGWQRATVSLGAAFDAVDRVIFYSAGNTWHGINEITIDDPVPPETTPPTLAITVADSALSIGETSLVTFTFSEPVADFSNADVTAPSGTLTAVSTSDGGTTWTATFTPSAATQDASNMISVDMTGLQDAASNPGVGTVNSGDYSVDTQRPTATVVVADTALAVGETSLLTVTFSEAVTGFTTADLTVANGALSAMSSLDGGLTWTATLTPTAGATDASNLITLDNSGVVDASGNAGSGTTDSNNYSIDTQRPTASVVVSDTALRIGETSLLTVTFTEAVAGFTNADLTVANGTLSPVSSLDGGVTWTATLTPTAGVTDASNLITLDNSGVADAFGNAGSGTTDSNNYAIDSLRPTASLVVEDAALRVGETSLVTITFSEAVAGFTNGDLAVANGALSSVSSSNGGVTWTATLTPTAGVTAASNVITLDNTGVVDAAGNSGAGTTDSNNYAIDTEAPGAPSTPDLAPASDSGTSSTDNITNVATPVFAGTAESGSTVTLYDTDGTTVLGTATASGGAWSITASSLAAGVHTITAKATDAAGNVSAASSGLAVTIDTTAPTISSQPTGGTFVAGGSFTLTVAATDASSMTYRWRLGGVDLSDGSTRSGSSTASITHTSIGTVGFAGDYTVVITDAAGNSTTSAAATVVVNKADQTITFPAIADKVATDDPFTITATASTGFAVTFSVISGPATVSGNTVTLTGGGTVTIRASQAGDLNYNAATAERTFSVTKAAATVTLGDLAHTYDGSAKAATATTSPSSLTVDLTYDGASVAPVAAGSYAVVATINDPRYQGSTSGTLTVAKATQTITFAQPADRTVESGSFALTATASSGLPVTFSIVSGPATLSGATVSLAGAPGAVTVRASQSGDSNYVAATEVTRTFAVTSPSALMSFGAVSDGSIERGRVAAQIAADGNSGVLIGYLPGAGGFVLNLTFDVDRAFVGTTESLNPASSGIAAATWTFRGQVLAGALVGSIDELSFTFSASLDPLAGATAAIAGYYVAPTLDTTNGRVHTMIGTTGKTFVLALLDDIVVGNQGTADASTGDFVVATGSGVLIDGNADAVSRTVDGAVIRPGGGAVTEFAGPAAGVQRTDRLINLSSRARVQSGEGVTIAGFVVSGSAPKPVLLRAVGPGLVQFNVSGALEDPKLTLLRGSTVLGTNDDWGSAANATEIADAATLTSAFGLSAGSKDAAILITLAPGNYTAIVESNGSSGVALAEVYDASPSGTSAYQRLVNISTRAHVGPGADTLIGGFFITGNAAKRVLVRGVGPKLSDYGVSGVLADPKLTVFQGPSALASNDNWGTGPNSAADLAAAATAASAFGLDAGSKDAALIITLAPGSYTAHVTGADGSSGIALVEVYELP